MVAAVAGSRKTETLIGRVRHLLRDYDPNQIAVVMFNKDAAQTFRNRLERAVRSPLPEIRIFNSMGFKIVNRFVQLGLLLDARIEEKDFRRTKLAKDAFTRVFKQLNGDTESPEKELIDAFIAFILLVKSDDFGAIAHELLQCGVARQISVDAGGMRKSVARGNRGRARCASQILRNDSRAHLEVPGYVQTPLGTMQGQRLGDRLVADGLRDC